MLYLHLFTQMQKDNEVTQLQLKNQQLQELISTCENTTKEKVKIIDALQVELSSLQQREKDFKSSIDSLEQQVTNSNFCNVNVLVSTI